jgi:glucan 1,3-beta-glucosidase
MANVHPWFGGVAIADAAQWTMTFFQNQDVDPANQVPNKPQMSIAETGELRLQFDMHGLLSKYQA